MAPEQGTGWHRDEAALRIVLTRGICAVGQTLAAQDLASSLRPYMRTHYVQPNVGHYGVFSGRRWQNHIYPVVRNVIHVSQ
jgi:poly(3-hydroxybutyrate) depolymerase